MRGVWVGIAIGLIAAVGCTPTPKREMKQPLPEELVSPTDNYKDPPEYSRDQPILTPKSSGPGAGPGQLPGTGGPTGPGGSPGGLGARR